MPHSHPIARLLTPIMVAAGLWFYMFSPWTAGLTNFWYTMTASALILIFMAWSLGRDSQFSIFNFQFSIRQLLLGIALAAALWGVFWVGDKLSSLMFGFARGQVDSIYGMKTGIQPWIIALLLLFIIGPAEELFWRGFVQQQLSSHWGENWGFVVTTAIYTLIHLWSFNFMLIMAALVCGIVWGGLYRLQPKWLPALVVSHAVWDACVFVVFPI